MRLQWSLFLTGLPLYLLAFSALAQGTIDNPNSDWGLGRPPEGLNEWSEILRTVALTAGALLGAYGIWLALRRTRSLELQAETDRLRLDHQAREEKAGRITDNFTRAIDQLGSNKMEVRLGAIYALERIARESKEDHWPIIETLTAYVRERSPWPPRSGNLSYPEKSPEPPIDIRAVLTVLARRETMHEEEGQELDLSKTDLRGVSIVDGSFGGANFIMSNLRGVLAGGIDLKGAHLRGTILQGALLDSGDLQEAALQGVDLSGASLSDCNLEGAVLFRADLNGAMLAGANLRQANLAGVDGLTQDQLVNAHGNNQTQLPVGLSIGPSSE